MRRKGENYSEKGGGSITERGRRKNSNFKEIKEDVKVEEEEDEEEELLQVPRAFAATDGR